MSKVIKMSLKDILKRTDVIMRENDIVYICDDINVIKEFVSKFKNGVDNRQEVKKFLIENEKYINKEKFILLIVKNYKDNLALLDKKLPKYTEKLSNESTPESFSKLAGIHMQIHQQKENLENAIKIGKGIETIFSYYYYDEYEKRYRVGIVDSREVIDERKINNRATKRFDEVDLNFKGGDPEEKYGLEYLLQALLLTDLYNVFPSEQLGNEVRTMILENQVIKSGIKTREELEELKTLEKYEEYANIIDNINFEGLLPEIKKTLREYSEYIDMDKLLLISAYRFCEALENGTVSEKVHSNVKEILDGILKNIKVSNTHISCKLQNKIDNSYELEAVDFSIKEIKKHLSRFAGNTYLTSSKIQEYREKTCVGEIKLNEFPSEYIDTIFSKRELEQLSLLSSENLMYVFQKNNWETSKVISLYENSYISLEIISKIKDNIDLSGAVSLEKLNLYYKAIREQNENNQAKIEYKRYLELYKEVFISGKNNEEVQEISSKVMESIVENFEGNEYDEAIKDYFKAGLINLDSILEWNNEDIIIKLFNEKQISLEDVNGLVAKGKLSVKYLNDLGREIINNEDMEYSERLRLIKSGFIKEEDIFDLYKKNLIFESDLLKLAEDKIIGSRETQRIINSRTMEELEKNSAIKLTGLNTLTKKNNDIYVSGGNNLGNTVERKLTEKVIIDPNERERFLRLLKAYRANTDLNEDSPFYNYEFYVIPDESGTIGLNSVVIAERYYEDKDTETKFATNNATYFFKYKDLMVLSNLRKSEMTKERENIVFTANHVIANETREGSWAKSVLTSLAKTMMSCDLKEYSKKNQQIIVRQKLKQIYTPYELNDILQMATEIDLGEYLGVIEEPIVAKRKGKSKSISKDAMER